MKKGVVCVLCEEKKISSDVTSDALIAKISWQIKFTYKIILFKTRCAGDIWWWMRATE